MVPGLFAPVKGEGKKSKRVLNDIDGRVDLEFLYKKIMTSKGWPYKMQYPSKFVRRDRGLIAAIILTCGRVNEVLAMRKDQISQDADHPDFIVIKKFQVSKRKGGDVKKNIFMDERKEVAIPIKLRGDLWDGFVPFSKLFLEHANSVKSGKIFRVCDKRCLQIVEATLGVWNHYLRSVGESYLLKIMKDNVVTAKYLKVTSKTLEKYAQPDWRDFTKK